MRRNNVGNTAENLQIKDEKSYLIMLSRHDSLMNLHELKFTMIKVSDDAKQKFMITRKQQEQTNARILPINAAGKRLGSMVVAIQTIEQPSPDKLDCRCVYRFLTFE